jgi:hypothetical protein
MIDPAVIERLKSLEVNGVIAVHTAWEDAKDPDSPLHSHVQWDQAKAAYKHQIGQLRELIRSVRLEVVETKHKIKVIGYVRDPDAPPLVQGYINTARLRDDKDKARSALIREISAAENAMSRAYDVADSVGLSDKVEEIIAMIRGIRQSA